MDEELARTLREHRDFINERFSRLDGVVDGIRRDAQEHYREDAAAFAEIRSSASQAHKRIDQHLIEHRDEKGGRVQLWVGVVLAFVTALITAFFGLFGGKKP